MAPLTAEVQGTGLAQVEFQHALSLLFGVLELLAQGGGSIALLGALEWLEVGVGGQEAVAGLDRFGLLARFEGWNRLVGQQVGRGELALLQVQAVDQAEGDRAVEDGALPAAEDIDRPRGEALHHPGRCGALAFRGQGGREAAARQVQVLLQQREHGFEVGALRQSIAPAPLERFEHGGADLGLEGHLPQVQAPGFPLAFEPPAHLQQGIFRFGDLRSGALSAVTPAQQTRETWDGEGEPRHSGRSAG